MEKAFYQDNIQAVLWIPSPRETNKTKFKAFYIVLINAFFLKVSMATYLKVLFLNKPKH